MCLSRGVFCYQDDLVDGEENQIEAGRICFANFHGWKYVSGVSGNIRRCDDVMVVVWEGRKITEGDEDGCRRCDGIYSKPKT